MLLPSSRCMNVRRRAISVVKAEVASTIDEFVDSVLGGKKSQIHPYWLQRLKSADRPAARALIPQLTAENTLGFVPSTAGASRRGTLLEYVLKEKKRHGDKIVLTRVGDFYECYGIDAIMLVQYAGLNPMGGKARAGCPVRNVQNTLDSLTAEGLIVAVYEELKDVNAARGPTSKVRFCWRYK